MQNKFQVGQLVATRVVVVDDEASGGRTGRITAINDGVATLLDSTKETWTTPVADLIPAVHYDVRKPVSGKVGERAAITAVDHPDFPANEELSTSAIEFVGPNGMFQTKNTMYVPNGMDVLGIGLSFKSPYLTTGDDIEILEPLEA